MESFLHPFINYLKIHQMNFWRNRSEIFHGGISKAVFLTDMSNKFLKKKSIVIFLKENLKKMSKSMEDYLKKIHEVTSVGISVEIHGEISWILEKLRVTIKKTKPLQEETLKDFPKKNPLRNVPINMWRNFRRNPGRASVRMPGSFWIYSWRNVWNNPCRIFLMNS